MTMETRHTPPADAGSAETLSDYLARVWRYRVLIGAVTVIAVGVALATSLLGPAIYESTVTFAATQSKIGDSGQPVANTAAFRPMVESLTTAAAVIRETGLDKPPYSLRPSDFLEQVITVAEVRGTNLITVKVDHTDPTMAATIANSVANHAVLTARTVSSTEATHARDMIKEQLDGALARLDVADARLRQYRQEARIEALRKEIESRLGGPQLPVFSQGQPVFVQDPAGGRLGLAALLAEIASEKAKLTTIERELAGRSRVDPTTKSADAVYQNLDATAAATRSHLASLEQQRTQLLGAHPIDAGTAAVLNQLYEIETELGRRQVERNLAEKIYIDLSQKFQEARLQVIGRSAEFVIIDPAVPADRPLSRHLARNAVVAAAIWFSFALAAVLMWDVFQRRRATL